MTHERLNKLLTVLCGQECWYVSCGGCVGSTFMLSLGKKLRRVHPVNNPAHTIEYREFGGEFALLAWCSWRLFIGGKLVASAVSPEDKRNRELEAIAGRRVVTAYAEGPMLDLKLTFDREALLELFCDNTDFNGDWEICARDECAYIGPQGHLKFKPRQDVVFLSPK